MTKTSPDILDPYEEIEEEYQDILYSHASDSAAHYGGSLHESSSSWSQILEHIGDSCGSIDDKCYLGYELEMAADMLENTSHLGLKNEDEEIYLLIGRASGFIIDKNIRTPEYLIGEVKKWESGDTTVPNWRFIGEIRTPSFLKDTLNRPPSLSK